MSPRRILTLLFVLPLLAAVAFTIVEGWSFFDALYMAVITLTTVGFHEVHPLSDAGRVIVICYLVAGLGVFFFGVAYVGELVLRTPLKELRKRRKMSNALKDIEGHIVICGFGRVGSKLCSQLATAGQAVVVIDRDESAVEEAVERGLIAIAGDATDDETLEAAGVGRARALAAVLPSDADNLYVVLSARIFNPTLQIVSRSSGSKSVEKLERAGANRIVSLYETGALRMAQLLTHPSLEDFMQFFTAQGDRLDLGAISVQDTSPYCHKRLDQTDFRERGVMIVAHQKPGRELAIPPTASAHIDAGDTLFAFGDAKAIMELIGGPV